MAAKITSAGNLRIAQVPPTLVRQYKMTEDYAKDSE